MERRKTRRKQLLTALSAVVISFLLFASFYHHLFRDLFSTVHDPTGDDDSARYRYPATNTAGTTITTTVYNIHNEFHRHYVIMEPHHHHLPGGGESSSSARPSVFPSPPPSSAVLLPDWEVLLLVPPDQIPNHLPSSCLFQNDAISTANFTGVIPSSRRATFRCTLPSSVRRLRPFYTPRLISSRSPAGVIVNTTELLRWNFLAYESLSTADDVIVFAKGVNHRAGVGANRPAGDLRCVFYVPEDAAAAATAVKTAVTSSSQEVFRCLHPDAAGLRRLLAAGAGGVRISLEIRNESGAERKLVPSLARYHHHRPRAPTAHDKAPAEKSLLCACTMVHNVAKFLREWVMYHSRVGVDRFILYDNGSDDDLDRVVSVLRSDGYNATTILWPWPKTQEAGFSHCAAASRDSCEWMMYLDVDEFAFSPAWSNSSEPSQNMLRSLLPTRPNSRVGQISMGCYEFGPSNRTVHPANGVSQGYTCRRRQEERHKSIVRLGAVDPSLGNVVHHFRMGEGYRGRKVRGVVVNHYKYQAWAEFKSKFRRRVSAYVADWTEAVNPASKDRAPGLGFSAVEPKGWAGRFCEVRDDRMRDVGRRWFAVGEKVEGLGPTGEYRMAWQ